MPEQYIWTALVALLTGGISWVGSRAYHNGMRIKQEHTTLVEIAAQFDTLMKDHAVLMESQRNQIKNSIVRICEEALRVGWISSAQLEALLRDYESYVKLGGNSYVKSLLERVKRLPIKDDHLPIEVVAEIEEYIIRELEEREVS